MQTSLPDTQNKLDTRNIPIDFVGIRDLRYPIRIAEQSGTLQSTVAVFSMYVGLPADKKGTHMSRFIELLEEKPRVFSLTEIARCCAEMTELLDAKSGLLTCTFPFFREKTAPISKKRSLLDYTVRLYAEYTQKSSTRIVQVTVPVTSLCPCSKKISDFGAHNQRSHVCVRVCCTEDVSIESIITLVEANASCDLYAILKRPDEKYVTERAYENPVFVEDIVRDIAQGISDLPGVVGYSVDSENFESIHNHSAYARITHNMPPMHTCTDT